MPDAGKKFESRFKLDWENTVPGSFIYRLNDQMSGYRGSSNPCDFITYATPIMFLVECKEHKGNTFPFSAFRQYERLLEYKGIKGVHAGVVLWFSDHDRVLWIPIETFEKLKQNNKKSFNIGLVGTNYECLELPSRKLRTFMETDYGYLVNYYRS